MSAWVWDLKIKGSIKIVLLSLVNHADDDKCCRSINQLSKDCGINKKTVINAIKYLDENFIIEVNAVPGSATIYKIHNPKTVYPKTVYPKTVYPKTGTPKKVKTVIKQDFKPSNRCLELISNAKISIEFAESLINEFVFYWQERGDKRVTWDTTFLNHVKKQWSFKNEANGKNNQFTENQKLEESNRRLYEQAEQLEREANQGGFYQALDATADTLPTKPI